MTDNSHPITPPSEDLVNQWDFECESEVDAAMHIATQAARWGADQELEACCEWLELHYPHVYTTRLKRCRRPKPPSLKEQALAKLEAMERLWEASGKEPSDTIRRAIESLPG